MRFARTILICVVSLQPLAVWAEGHPVELKISRSSIAQSAGQWTWLQARTAYVQGEEQMSVTTMSQTWNDKTHDYRDVYQTISRDGGATWSPATAIPSLRLRKTSDGYDQRAPGRAGALDPEG